MEKRVVRLKKLPHFKGELPKYETAHASGFDLRARLEKPLQLGIGARALVPTGLAVEIPVGFEIQIRPRSGWATKKGITVVNSPGTIDADYRGEIQVALINLGQESMEILDQDRICQAVLCPVVQAEFVLADELSSTERGESGFGSTGFSNKT